MELHLTAAVIFHTGSHGVTCHPTQVNTPRLNPTHIDRYPIYLPQRDEKLSWPIGDWPVTYRNSLQAHRRSAIEVLTQHCSNAWRESNWSVDHKFGVLTTTPPSHRMERKNGRARNGESPTSQILETHLTLYIVIIIHSIYFPSYHKGHVRPNFSTSLPDKL